MTLNISALADWTRLLSFLITVIQIALTIGLIYLGSKFVGKKDCEKKCQENKKTLDGIKDRQKDVEQTLEGIPSVRDMRSIDKRLGDIEGDVKALRVSSEAQTDAMERLERPVNLLLQHHLGREK